MSNNHFVVRRAAGPSEIEKARDLTEKSWRDTYPSLIGEKATDDLIDIRLTPQRFEDDAALDGGYFLVAFDPLGRVVGHLHADPRDGALYIHRLHVDPSVRSQGAGGSLLDFLKADADGADRIWLTVLKENEAAAKFYEENGFSAEGETGEDEGLGGKPSTIYAWNRSA